MIVINDVHLGAIRSAGTTIGSALALREWMLEQFKSMLEAIEEDLVILGDLFDTYSIPAPDLLAAYQHLQTWLRKSYKLTLVPGNHDLSKDSAKLSSFEFMAKLLLDHPNVQYIRGGGWVDEGAGVYAISHVTNQDLLDMEFGRVPECTYLLLHANYDNNFAVNSDHSLNVSKAQAEAAPCRHIFFAHEHYHRICLGGKVYVGGNQLPSSVSDCLDGQDKYFHRLTSEGVERIKSWDKTGYAELDWQNPESTDALFIRFKGMADAEQAADVADTIARYRKGSDAFVVSNAVAIGGDEAGSELALESLERINEFYIMSALKDYLEPAEMSILEKLE